MSDVLFYSSRHSQCVDYLNMLLSQAVSSSNTSDCGVGADSQLQHEGTLT